MQVRQTAINQAVGRALSPGDFTTGLDGAARPIESFGTINVMLRDAAGQPLNLHSGGNATICIPLGRRKGSAPSTIPLFFFDAAGRWVQEGTTRLAGTAPNRCCERAVARFSTWNTDQAMAAVRVTGCVADANGMRIAGARVAAGRRRHHRLRP